MQDKKTSIQKFGDVCIINLERKQDGAEAHLENILEACKEAVEILFEHKELKSFLDKDSVDLVQSIIDRNAAFYKKNDDEMKVFCFNVIALRDLKNVLVDNKALEKTGSEDLKKGIEAIILTLDLTIKVIDRVSEEEENTGLLRTIFEDGVVYNEQTMSEIRETINKTIYE